MDKEFRHNEKAYLAWVQANPNGYVLNRYSRENSKNYMVLHSARCRQINKPGGTATPGGFTERAYVKICAMDRQALIAYVRAHGRPDGTFSKVCQTCNPR